MSDTPPAARKRHANICRLCRRRYLPPIGRPRIGVPARICPRCVAAEAARVEDASIEAAYQRARQANKRAGRFRLEAADCWAPQTMLAALAHEQGDKT